jgi:EAL domain-containing protein (putative c-di-GMP-specific phosphodiesterase class I)
MRAGDVAARPGADEFVLVMRDLHDPAEAFRTARRLVEAFRRPLTALGTEFFSTVSIGVAVATRAMDAESGDDLLRQADTAMHQAKAEGRDRVALYNEELRNIVSTRLAVEGELRHALERDQLAVWYQPEVDLATGAVIAVEALLRWHHPDGSVWTADRFIDVAEETGLILDIGEWVLRQACAQLAAWAATRPDRPIVVRVNKSALQIADPRLLPAVDTALADSGADPTQLCVEITETALLRQTTTASANLAGIHERGVTIAIDDFGTGYASLSYLRRYPIDVIKIDRSFVTNITTDAHDQAIAAAIIALAGTLGITVTAEGVEHSDQATCLRDMGCPGAQGWLYSKALPAIEATALLDHIYPHP